MADDPTTTLSHARGDELLDRERELLTLASAIDDAARGDARLVVVEGPAGIGKSRLLAEARARATAAGLRVLTARGSELEQEFPFGVVRQLLEPLLVDPGARERLTSGAAAAAAPVFDPVGVDSEDDPGDPSFGVLHGLYWLTFNVTADGPLLIAVDDLHWCDRASLRYLAYLVRRLEGLPALVVAGLRTTEPGTDISLLGEIAGDPDAVAVRPGRLSRQATHDLVRDRLGADAHADFAAACHELTGGNPLLLRQLLRSLETERIAPTAANADAVRDIGPRAVSRTVLLRLSRLPADATKVAQATAVLGDGADLPAIAALAGFSEQSAATAITALARAEILRAEPPLGFVHALVRDAIYLDLAPGERELQHGRAADLLRAAGASTEQVTAHLLIAPPRADPAAARLLREAGRAALQRGAPDSAVSYLRRALEEPPPDELRGPILVDLGTAEERVTGPAAVGHFRAAYEVVDDPRQRALVARMLARTLVFVGTPEETHQAARRALADLPSEYVDERQWLEAWSVIASIFGSGPELAELDEYAARRTGTGPGAKALAAVIAAHRAARGGDREECVALALEALEGDVLWTEDAVPALHSLMVLLMSDPDQAVAFGQTALAHAQRQGSVFSTVGASLWTANGSLLVGELDEAVRRLGEARELYRLWSGVDIVASYFAAVLIDSLRERGDLAAARDALEASGQPSETGEGPLMWRASRTRLLLAEGRPEEALASAEEYEALTSPGDNPAWRPRRSLKALALHALGRSDEAVPLAAEELELARRWGAPWVVGRTLRVLGTVEGDRGVDHLREAVELLADSPAQLEHAKALAALGTALRGAGQVDEARDVLRRALDLADRCGAQPLVDQVRAELTAAGARPRAAALAGVDSLTASERRVATLAAEGSTNREIAESLYVTPKTVEVHLTNVYRKLGVRSRRELIGAQLL